MSNTIPSISKPASQLPKWLGLLFTLIGLLICAVLWATSAHSEQKAWTAGEIHDTKIELKADAKEKYVPLHEFTAVQQDIKYQSYAITEVKSTLKDINKKLDKLGNRRTNGRRGNDVND